jgi:polyhydroxybutyrate depolymerase
MIRALPAALLIAATMLLPAAARADANRTIDVAGLQRSYVIHLPPATASAPHPLLLMFHGGGGSGKGMARLTRIESVADRAGFIVVYPDGIDHHWNDGRATIKHKVDDVGFIARLIDSLGHEYAIDRSRVAVAGISNGAVFAERLGCDLADRIAVVAAVSGTLAADYASRCHPARPVSILQFDGTADPIMPYAGGHVADFGGRGEGGDVLSVDATAAFWSRMDGCGAGSHDQSLPVSVRFDPTRVTLASSGPCRDGTAVRVYSITGGGHTWPGGMQYLPRFIIGRGTRQIDASDIIVHFVRKHPRASG